MVCKSEKANEENGNSAYPLFLSAFGDKDLQSLIKKIEIYMQKMVKQYRVTTIPAICAGTCRHLKTVSIDRCKEDAIRIVLMLQNVDQAIDLLQSLQGIAYDQIIALAETEQSLIVKVTGKNHAIDNFIAHAKIENDIIESFVGHSTAPSLPLSIFKRTRHWPDAPIKKWSIKSTLLDDVTNLRELLEKEMSEVREMLHTNDFRPIEECEAMIDRLAATIIARFFNEISLTQILQIGRTFDTRELFENTNIHEHYYLLFQTMLKHLAKVNMIKINRCILGDLPAEFLVLGDLNELVLNENPHKIAEHGMKLFREHFDTFERLLLVMPHIKNVLTSDLSPMTVFFPTGDLTLEKPSERMGDALGNIYLKKYIQAISKYVQLLAKNSERTVRLLEIGGGLGQITRQLAPKLAQFAQVEYWFTDIGTGFVNYAKKHFANISNMKFCVFDITKTTEEQGIEHKFDAIVGLNVIHATENIRQTTANLSSTLTEDGVLFIIENTQSNIIYALTDGLFDGWWYFKDYDLRWDALCSALNWERALAELNFGTVYSLPTNKDEREYVEKFMFVCCKQNLGPMRELEAWWEQKNLQNSASDKVKPKRKLIIERNYSSILKVLEEIWKRVLGIDRRIRENEIFRELGGESLLVIQLRQELNDHFGLDIKAAHIYANPSLKECALFIKSLMDEMSQNENEKPQEVDVGGNVDLNENSVREQKDEIPRENIVEQTASMLMFCGQGSQKEGMLQSLVDDPHSREILEKAKRVIGVDLIEEGKKAESLQLTSFIQTALFVGSIAKVKQFAARNHEVIKNIRAVAGLSVGEFAALTYAGVLEFEDALKIVRQRGLAMQKVVDTASTAMCSILGPTTSRLTNFLSEKHPNLMISGYLADDQHTVAGENEKIDTFLEQLKEENVIDDLNLKDARKLRVAGAFHTDHMRKAASDIELFIDSIEFKKPNIPIILNANGQAVNDPKAIRELVKIQLTSPLQWKQTILKAVAMGVRNFIEISPSPILTAIIRKRIQECADTKCTAEFQKF
ncbi:hypothetical protein B4U79_16219 [Dinothrombium tinctorium]|uniref:Fatty acid synthase n=1 Tax=Dinothrombium tinctorium TaxID=1965070 RepID=A0A443QTP6_9ACAR|nr:hypothetical protein B4U79_16219 [Dinothrombium tinctorium]